MRVTADKSFQWRNVGPEDREKALGDLLELSDAVRPHPPRSISSVEKVSAVNRALLEAEIPHAFGGALAIAYYGEPRMTSDIDVNVFVPPNRWPLLEEVLRPLGVEMEIDQKELNRFGELELVWDSNLLHLFFSTDLLHQRMSEKIRRVPFSGDTIPIVAPEHLVVRKAQLDRTKDWLDIETVLIATSPFDFEEVETWLIRLVGKHDPRVRKARQVRAGLAPN